MILPVGWQVLKPFSGYASGAILAVLKSLITPPPHSLWAAVSFFFIFILVKDATLYAISWDALPLKLATSYFNKLFKFF